MFLSSFGVLLRFSPVENVYIYPHDIVVGIIALLGVIYFFFSKKKKNFQKIFSIVIIFNIVSLLSLFLNFSLQRSELITSFSYLLRFDAYVALLLLALIPFSKSQMRIQRGLFIGITIFIVIFGFFQYFFYNNLRNLYYLGWDEHLYRLFSVFLDPNFAGLFFALFLLVLLGHFIFEFGYNKYLYGGVFALTFAALLLTYSRTALISFFCGAVFLLLIKRKYAILGCGVFVMIVGILLVSDFSIEGMNPLRIASSEARVRSFQESFSIFQNNPILGVGFNAYRYAQIDAGFRSEHAQFPSNADAGTDNSLLFVLATTGVVGFIVYVLFWIQIIKLGVTSRKKVSFIAIILTFFIGSQFINALFFTPLLLWVFLYTVFFVVRD